MATKKKTFADEVKALLEENKRIALHDLAMQKVDEVLSATSLEALPVNIATTFECIEKRLQEYESILGDLEALIALTAYWTNGEYQLALQKVLVRLAENEQAEQNNSFWLRLRWYPFARIIYIGGLAAVIGGQYKNLACLMKSRIEVDDLYGDVLAVSRLKKSFTSLYDPIQSLPQFIRHYTPVSDHFFLSLHPALDKLIVVGKQYEAFFDQFEVLIALLHSDLVKRQEAFYGRFVWKYRRLVSDSPTNSLVVLRKEAEQDGDKWPLFQAGLFGGSFDRFDKAYEVICQQIENSNWFS